MKYDVQNMSPADVQEMWNGMLDRARTTMRPDTKLTYVMGRMVNNETVDGLNSASDIVAKLKLARGGAE